MSKFLTRESYKGIKRFNRNQLEEYIVRIYKLGLADGAKDAMQGVAFPALNMDSALLNVNKELHKHLGVAVGGKRFNSMKEGIKKAIEGSIDYKEVGQVEFEEIKEQHERDLGNE